MAKTAKKATVTTRTRRQAAAQREEGPRYQVLSDSYIDNVYYRAGAEVVYYGQPGSQLRPLNAEAKSRKLAVREIRTDPGLDADQKLAKLAELSDEWNGVEEKDAFDESEADLDDTDLRRPNARNTEPLPAAERAVLEGHVKATLEQAEKERTENTNKVSVQLQGDPADPEGKQSKAGIQGATPVLDGKQK